MEIDQCEPDYTFLDDISKLVLFVKMHNNVFTEYIRVTRMYLFGTPIRRTGAGFRRATPGYASIIQQWRLVVSPGECTDVSDWYCILASRRPAATQQSSTMKSISLSSPTATSISTA